MAAAPCFECLQRRIESDFSADLIFRHGVSNSGLPFGSAAVVQILSTGGVHSVVSKEVSTEFVLVALPNSDNGYYSPENDEDDLNKMSSSGKARCQIEFDDDIFSDCMPGHLESDPLLSLNCSNKGLAAANFERATTSSHDNLSCFRTIAALSPLVSDNLGLYATIKDLIGKYLSGSTEDLVISSLNLFAEGKLPGQYSIDFLNLVGFPAFGETNIPKSVRHPNISPFLGILKTPLCYYLLQPKTPYTLENILHFSPRALKSDWHIRFLIYQILSALAYMHGIGVSHGNICPSSILFTDSLWPWLNVSDMRLVRGYPNLKEPDSFSSRLGYCMEHCPCPDIYADLELSTSIDWHSHFKRWLMGELSNFEYLLLLNRLAERRWGDHTFHTVMPWVIDFSVKPNEHSDSGWRDLKKSKWRLAKAACSYKARRLPLSVLRSAVRSVYEPNEYPSNMQRLYQWTPDECIPEFYCDPRIFISLHPGMSDLAVPSWSESPEDFISLHRDALESQRVSQQIHHWIDITFGYKLSGEASIEAKNVMLPVSDLTMLRSIGRRQLFTKPHPMRRGITPYDQYGRCKETQTRFEFQGMEMSINSSTPSDNTSPWQLPSKDNLLPETSYMEHFEKASLFSECFRYLNPIYSYRENSVGESSSRKLQGYENPTETSDPPTIGSAMSSDFDFGCFLEHMEVDDDDSTGFQELLRDKAVSPRNYSEDLAGDIFSIGCILAEVYLKKPLFDPVSLAAYKETRDLPETVHELPPHVALLVEASVERDWSRFIDIVHDRKLHLWKSDTDEYSLSSLVSAICSCGSENVRSDRTISSPSWMATGLSSGHCRLLDARSGDTVALWRAHDGYISKLAAPEDHLLVSSSLDKTLRVWDLRKNLASQSQVFRGHPDGISSFSVWGQDVISISKDKIALTSLSRLTDECGHQRISPQKLYYTDRGTRNISVLSTITVLPFSRLFLVGTEDGHLKICC